MGSMKGKVAIVTGASTLIGQGVVRALHDEGASIVMADIAVDDGQAFAGGLDDRILFVETDITSDDALDELVSKTVETFGGIDYLVNLASTYMDEGVKRRSTPDESAGSVDGPMIENSIFESLAETIGADAMIDLLGKIEIDLRSVKNQIIDANNTADSDLMRSATHVLISVAGAVGGVRLQGQAERLNALEHAGDFANVSALTDETLDELDGVLDYVTEKIRTGVS